MANKTILNKQYKASEFEVKQWIDASGKMIKPIRLSDLSEKFKIVYCFQSWCPGCHERGFPSLQKMVEAIKDHDKIKFLAIQTVFEGFEENNYDQLIQTQKKYKLKIPFGHDAGDDGKSMSNMMRNYRTGGTPWFIFIDKHDNVVFADFHLNSNAAIEFLKTL